jgi:hypothetical protein
VPNGEEDERSGEQQRQHVAEGRERKRHGRREAGSRASASGERQRRALWVKPFTSPGSSHDRRRRRRRLGARPPNAPAHHAGLVGALCCQESTCSSVVRTAGLFACPSLSRLFFEQVFID